MIVETGQLVAQLGGEEPGDVTKEKKLARVEGKKKGEKGE